MSFGKALSPTMAKAQCVNINYVTYCTASGLVRSKQYLFLYDRNCVELLANSFLYNTLPS